MAVKEPSETRFRQGTEREREKEKRERDEEREEEGGAEGGVLLTCLTNYC